jgi:chemotaxis protein MotA
MFVIVGWLVALGCIFGVFIVHGGNIGVVLKALPFEMTTIMGAAIGAFVACASRAASTPRRVTWN